MIYAVTTLLASNAFLGNVKLPGGPPEAVISYKAGTGDPSPYGGVGSPSEVGGTGMPGDVGFDPLGLANFDLSVDGATDKQRSAALVLRDYRDAELKHGRLAMLAAVAWPLQEQLNPYFAAKLHMPNLVAETGGLSPSVLNGGLEQAPVAASVLAFAAMVSAVELQGLRIKEATPVNEWRVGDYGTARIAEPGTEQFFSLQEGEIWNGRIAMIAIFAYVVQEALTGFPTANTIPFFLPALP